MCTTTKKTKLEREQVLLVRLQTALRTNDESRVWTRVVALGEYDTCGRCGGCGQYSYCQMHGTTCFGCGGSGKKRPKLTAGLCERIEAHVAAGKLDTYLQNIRLAAEAKHAGEKLFAAWRAQPEVAADKAAGKGWWHQSDLCAAINTVCAALCDATRNDASGTRWDATTKRNVPLSVEERAANAAHILKAVELASRSQAAIEALGGDVKEAAEIVKTQFLAELG